MDKEKNHKKEDQQQADSQTQENRQRSSAFNEPGPETQKSTSNFEEADMEQERKEAMTERD